MKLLSNIFSSDSDRWIVQTNSVMISFHQIRKSSWIHLTLATHNSVRQVHIRIGPMDMHFPFDVRNNQTNRVSGFNFFQSSFMISINDLTKSSRTSFILTLLIIRAKNLCQFYSMFSKSWSKLKSLRLNMNIIFQLIPDQRNQKGIERLWCIVMYLIFFNFSTIWPSHLSRIFHVKMEKVKFPWF